MACDYCFEPDEQLSRSVQGQTLLQFLNNLKASSKQTTFKEFCFIYLTLVTAFCFHSALVGSLLRKMLGKSRLGVRDFGVR